MYTIRIFAYEHVYCAVANDHYFAKIIADFWKDEELAFAVYTYDENGLRVDKWDA